MFFRTKIGLKRETPAFLGIYVANCRNGFGVEKFGEGKKTSLYENYLLKDGWTFKTP